MSIVFPMWPFIPAFRQRSASSAKALAVMAMMGIPRASPEVDDLHVRAVRWEVHGTMNGIFLAVHKLDGSTEDAILRDIKVIVRPGAGRERFYQHFFPAQHHFRGKNVFQHIRAFLLYLPSLCTPCGMGLLAQPCIM